MGLLRDGSGHRTERGPTSGPDRPPGLLARRPLAAFARGGHPCLLPSGSFARARSANPGGRPPGTPEGPDPHEGELRLAARLLARASNRTWAQDRAKPFTSSGSRIRGVRIRGWPALAGAASAAVAKVDQPAPIPDPT